MATSLVPPRSPQRTPPANTIREFTRADWSLLGLFVQVIRPGAAWLPGGGGVDLAGPMNTGLDVGEWGGWVWTTGPHAQAGDHCQSTRRVKDSVRQAQGVPVRGAGDGPLERGSAGPRAPWARGAGPSVVLSS